jgi:molybdopterin-guanine dinucleotide biosynthesis protein B
MVPVISFVGRHNSGKTTLLAGIVTVLEQQGFRIAVVKHASSGLDLAGDRDSDRLFQAGASMVYAASTEISLLYRREKDISLETICNQIGDEFDLIISEGFKKEAFPKIEVLRKDISTSVLDIDNVVARVTDFPLESSVPCFGFHEPQVIADFIIKYLGLCNSKG